MIEQADAHGVLGALLQNFPLFATDAAFAPGRNAAQHRHRANAAFSLMLTREADVLMACVRDLAAAIVKGPVFARTIYPKASLRCFTDIDILIAPEALPRMDEALADRGFRMAESNPASGPREWKWLHRDNDRVMVEVQTDLIHADSLHNVMSLPFSVIADGPDGPAASLLVALVHGGGHQYERLQHVVDICQAARALQGDAEERRFEDLVQAANARFVAVAGLALAHRIFREPRCREIARALGPVPHQRLAGLLLDQTVVMSTMDARRASHGWRRQAFRWLIKQGAALAA
ncbi:MAG: nucleotidyltransferase family protein [Bradyrhizobium sp.]|uniref:nucleotidyltransferase family protein n=1 Tax=Bradyrhizobium sp. TaxID=376 RepID=UPI00271ED2B6|nr:nucleotidyltransferase family protein [Bradyrhizobium sp.]MDO8400508.1 nucleotidyltransferase family protein [Bradyrhizobium sp.]